MPFTLPTYAINSVMLPTGKVLFYSFPPVDDAGARPNEGRAALWDPAKGTGAGAFTDVTPPEMDVDGDGDLEPAAIWCSGQSLLNDGRVLVTGGNSAFPPSGPFSDFAGLKSAFVFDPATETWARQGDMRRGRWYPSQTLLPDGRTAVLGGFSEEEPGGVKNADLETFSPGAGAQPGAFTHHASADRITGLYPHLFVVPGGNVLLGGPSVGDSGLLDTDLFSWRNPNQQAPTFQSIDRKGGTAVLRPGPPGAPARVSQFGGFDSTVPSLQVPATATGETLDLGSSSPAWANDAPLNIARAYANTTLLPDGSMVTVGGGNGTSAAEEEWSVYPDGRARQVELLQPGGTGWRLGPAQQEDRGYHSTAVLLPDGRVFSAGDERHPYASDGGLARTDTGEIYSPPYLFRGPRPAITSAPQSLRYGDEFGVGTGVTSVREAVLVAPSATTHAVDMNQRRVALTTVRAVPGKGLNAVSPSDPSVAPPGYYMLFAISSEGVPSVARWVRLAPEAPDAPSLAPDPSRPAPPRPAGAPAPPRDTARPSLRVSLVSSNLSALRRSGRLRLRVSVGEAARVRLRIDRVNPHGSKGRSAPSRARVLTFTRAERRRVTMRLPAKLRRALRGARSARLTLSASATDAAGQRTARRLRLRLRSPRRSRR